MSPAMRRAALRRLALRTCLAAALLVACVAALLPSAWLGVDPMTMRASIILAALGTGAAATLLSVATRKRPRVTAPRHQPIKPLA